MLVMCCTGGGAVLYCCVGILKALVVDRNMHDTYTIRCNDITFTYIMLRMTIRIYFRI